MRLCVRIKKNISRACVCCLQGLICISPNIFWRRWCSLLVFSSVCCVRYRGKELFDCSRGLACSNSTSIGCTRGAWPSARPCATLLLSCASRALLFAELARSEPGFPAEAGNSSFKEQCAAISCDNFCWPKAAVEGKVRRASAPGPEPWPFLRRSESLS